MQETSEFHSRLSAQANLYDHISSISVPDQLQSLAAYVAFHSVCFHAPLVARRVSGKYDGECSKRGTATGMPENFPTADH